MDVCGSRPLLQAGGKANKDVIRQLAKEFGWCGLTFITTTNRQTKALKITNSPGANLDAVGAFAKRMSRPNAPPMLTTGMRSIGL